jgi:transcription termination/antitermination protein NusA
VLVREDQLSLAIGRRGQNVRLASKLCGWDIEIMTREELEEQIDRAVGGFGQIDGITDELAEALVGEGFLSYDDLSVIEPDDLMEMGGLTQEVADAIIAQAESKAEEAEVAAADERRRQRDHDRAPKDGETPPDRPENGAAVADDGAPAADLTGESHDEPTPEESLGEASESTGGGGDVPDEQVGDET